MCPDSVHLSTKGIQLYSDKSNHLAKSNRVSARHDALASPSRRSCDSPSTPLLFVKYTKFFLSENEIDLVLKQVALEWCLLKMRRTGHGGV